MRHRIRHGEPKLQPVAAYIEGNAWIHVESNQVAIITPLSSTPVDIYYKRKATDDGVRIQPKTSNSFLVLPGVQFRIPDKVAFHLAVVPAEKVESGDGQN